MEENTSRRLKPITMKLPQSAYELSRALAQQRETDRPELDRQAYEIGLLFKAMEGAADETGMFGTMTGERLAELLRPHCLPLIEFLERYGQLPTVIHSLMRQPSGPPTDGNDYRHAEEKSSTIATDPAMFKGHTVI
jgi:hypothetical protein